LRYVVIFTGAIWAVFQYTEHVREQKVSAVLRYQKDLRTSPLFESWRRVAISNIENTKEQRDAQRKGGLSWLQYSISLAMKNRDDIELIVAFFNELRDCMQEGVCDKDAAVNMFGQEATDFYTFYGGYISCERVVSGDDTFASGVTSLRDELFWRQHWFSQLTRRPAGILSPTRLECAQLDR